MLVSNINNIISEMIEAILPIPKDEYSTGNKDSQCWAKVYGKNKAEVDKKIKKYMKEFPPEGYNTSIKKQGKEKGYFFAHLDRWHSAS